MVNPSQITTSQITTVPTDTWVAVDWDAFLTFAEDPSLVKGRFYYDYGDMRIEMSPLGTAHGRDNTIIPLVITLYAAIRQIPLLGWTNTSFRKTGLQEAQPDLAYLIGQSLEFPPRNNAPVNLNQTPPTLVVEIAATSLEDDLGRKQRLYQRLGVQEYWVVNVNASRVTAFFLLEAIEITTSQVLPDLAMALVEEALRRSQTEEAVSRWLLGEFQGQ